jgi:hypothetical protein
MLITCRACRHFAQGHGAPQALGLCQSTPWDSFQGQWPDKQHPCTCFAAKDQPK